MTWFSVFPQARHSSLLEYWPIFRDTTSVTKPCFWLNFSAKILFGTQIKPLSRPLWKYNFLTLNLNHFATILVVF